MKNTDMNILEFARKISMLSTDTPLANEFDKIYGQKEGRWWSCQREHLTVWCLHYSTGGVKGFLHKPSNSAAQMYNHFGRPETLLWLVETLMIRNKVQFDLQGLIDQIKEEHRPSSACAKIRKEIPFERILELLSD